MTLRNKLIGTATAAAVLAAGSAFAGMEPKFYLGAKANYNMLSGASLDKTVKVKKAVDGDGNITFTDNQPDYTAKLSQVWKFDKNAFGLSPFVGVKFDENFAFEASYDFNGTNSIKQKDGDKKKAGSYKSSAFNFDLVASMPMDESFSVHASVGYGHVTNKVKFEGAVDAKFKKDSEYTITKITDGKDEKAKLHADATFTPAKVEEVKESKGGIRFGLGLNYKLDDNMSIRADFRHQHLGKKNIVSDVTVKGINTIGVGMVFTV